MDLIYGAILLITFGLISNWRVGAFSLSLFILYNLFSDSGAFTHMTNQYFFLRHGVEEVIAAVLSVSILDSGKRRLGITTLLSLSALLNLYEYRMWFGESITYDYYETINIVMFEILVVLLLTNQPVRQYRWVRYIKKKAGEIHEKISNLISDNANTSGVLNTPIG